MPQEEKKNVIDAGKVAHNGFTIIETLVAIAILALALTGPMALAERGLVAARAAGQEVVAFYLAQEAFEFVKNMRDGNMLTGGGGASWLTGLNRCMDDDGCGIDASAESKEERIVACDEDNDMCVLSRHLGTPGAYERWKGIYGYPENRHGASGDWEKTSFRRTVRIDELEDGVPEAAVTVSVSWTIGAGSERSMTINGTMLRWYSQ